MSMTKQGVQTILDWAQTQGKEGQKVLSVLCEITDKEGVEITKEVAQRLIAGAEEILNLK